LARADLVEYVGRYVGESFVGVAAGAYAGLESTLRQQHVVDHVLRLLQLLGDVHVIVHSEHLRTLYRRQVLRTQRHTHRHSTQPQVHSARRRNVM